MEIWIKVIPLNNKKINKCSLYKPVLKDKTSTEHNKYPPKLPKISYGKNGFKTQPAHKMNR